jgi:hypothetical protein
VVGVTRAPSKHPLAAAAGFEQALLIRRPLDAPDDPKKLAYHLTFASWDAPRNTGGGGGTSLDHQGEPGGGQEGSRARPL